MKIGVILAGGNSSRFNSKLPKGLHKIDGKSIVSRIIDSFNVCGIDKIYIVVNNESYKYYYKENFRVDYLFQNKVNGTGSAFYCVNGLYNAEDEIIVVNSDCFIFEKDIILDFYNECNMSGHNLGLVVRKEENCFGYGRVIVKGNYVDIIEERDLDEETRKINIVNMGIYYFKGIFLEKYMKILNNECEENKITSLINKEECHVYNSESLILGVNDKKDFYNVNKLFYLDNCNKLISRGVKIYDINNTYISESIVVGENVEIYPNNYLLGNCVINDYCIILPKCYIDDSVIGEGCSIGPYA